MRKTVKTRKILTLIIILLLFSFTTACRNANSSKNLEIQKDSLVMDDAGAVRDMSYVKISDLFDENQKAVDRYSNVTEDGKIRWDVKEMVEYEKTPIANEMIKKITLDGKPIKLPMTFKDLGEEYKEFDEIDFSKFKEGSNHVVIINKKNNIALEIGYVLDKYLSAHIYSDNIFVLEVYVGRQNNKIVGFSNRELNALSEINLRVDGIGVGNTFNEMYEKFGQVRKIYKDYGDEYSSTKCSYYSKENNSIYFEHQSNTNKNKDNKIYKTKPNVITSIEINAAN